MFKFYNDDDKEVFIHNNSAIVYENGRSKVFNKLLYSKRWGFYSINKSKAESICLESKCKELDILSLTDAKHNELLNDRVVASIYYYSEASDRLGTKLAPNTYLINNKAYELLFGEMEA